MQDNPRQLSLQSWLDALPSSAAVFAWLLGLSIEKWLGLFGITFLALQMAGYLWRLRRDMRREEERQSSRMPGAPEGDTE